jgi:hypothetical protein
VRNRRLGGGSRGGTSGLHVGSGGTGDVRKGVGPHVGARNRVQARASGHARPSRRPGASTIDETIE